MFFFNFGFEEKSWPLTFFCFAVQFVCSKQTIKQFQRNEFKILYMRVFLKQMQTTDFAALIFKFVMWLLLVSRSWVVPRVGTKFSPTPLCSQPKFCEEGLHPFTGTKRIASIRSIFGFLAYPLAVETTEVVRMNPRFGKKSRSSFDPPASFSSFAFLSVIPVLQFLVHFWTDLY